MRLGPDNPDWPSRDEDCPARGVGLHHTTHSQGDDCVHCGVKVRVGPPAPLPPASDKERESLEHPKVVEFTGREVKRLKFLRWLRLSGRIG